VSGIAPPEAADDFESAVTYLVGVNPAAARRLVASVLGLIEWLAVSPSWVQATFCAVVMWFTAGH
jgi:hypothetical protein